MALTPDETARLAKLKAARDSLLTGTAVAEVEYDGVRTKFSQANAQLLISEIEKLEAKQNSARGRTRGAVSFYL